MDRVNKLHSVVSHYRIKMCAAFMTSCLQTGATSVERNSGYCLFWLIASRSLILIKYTPGHLSCVVLVDIFWKIEVVSVVDSDKESWFVLIEYAVMELRFFSPVNQGAMVFSGTVTCRLMASFHNFMFLIYFSIYCFFVFFAQQKSEGWGGHGP